MAAMGLVATPLAILAIPAATLIGFAFGAVGMAASTFMRSWQDFDLVMLFMLPLFLFSATFYPLDVYPPALRIAGPTLPVCTTESSSSGLSRSAPSTWGSSATWPT